MRFESIKDKERGIAVLCDANITAIDSSRAPLRSILIFTFYWLELAWLYSTVQGIDHMLVGCNSMLTTMYNNGATLAINIGSNTEKETLRVAEWK